MSESIKIPTCIGIILDGNRRWARKRGLPTLEGHTRGAELVQDAMRWVRDRGIKHAALYAFSTENWNRSEEEVSYLFELFKTMIRDNLGTLSEEGVRIRFVGQRERFSAELQEIMRDVEEKSNANTQLTVWVCLSYGGRAEIVEAVKDIAASGDEITEESLKEHMWTAEMPDPDIIIRPGGEHRLSNFLTWGSTYSELFFIQPPWPDFSEAILDDILQEYAARERRRGR